MSLHLDLARELESAAAARHAVDDLDLPEELIGDVRLLVSELVTNSLRHAGLAPQDTIRLSVESASGVVRVEVLDPGAPFEFTGRATDPEAVEGWGLYLVATLADRWGIEPPADGAGNRVWFELDRPGTLGQAAA